MTVILAAGALFTAVYDVIQSMDLSHTKIVTAATVDNTGKNSFGVDGTKYNSAETTTINFTPGTYVLVFNGQNGQSANANSDSWGAHCLAFYKGSSMTVVVGEGGGLGGYKNGGGRTKVATNFALPAGYAGEHVAIASGAGAYYGNPGYGEEKKQFNVVDGTFAGWEADGRRETLIKIGIQTNHIQGTPATQTHGGWLIKYIKDGSDDEGECITPNYLSGNDVWSGKQGLGGGAGYYDGGACVGTQYAGGGSCTPWCYPLTSSDIENGPKINGERQRMGLYACGSVQYFCIDPKGMPSGGAVAFGETVRLVEGGVGAFTPDSAVRNVKTHENYISSVGVNAFANYDCGIRAGWVYSVEKGVGWEGLAPDG